MSRRGGPVALVGLIGYAVIVVLVVLLLASLASYDSSTPATPTEPATTVAVPTPTATPEEDEPGWDCRVHGNLRCGDGEVRR